MKTIFLAVTAGALLLGPPTGSTAQEAPTTAEAPTATPAGIPLGSAWRRAVYAQANTHLQHPGWGVRHSERNYVLGMALAEAEGLTVDADVLFAAAFLHDWGGIAPFAVAGIDHAERSVQLAEPFLAEAGFPMGKFPAVRAAILGHMYDKEPEGPEAVVLHDADALDFLGALGAARLLAATGERPDYDQALGRIERFAVDIPPRLKTAAAREMAGPRVAGMTDFLAGVRRETPEGARP
ncbi:HD domain-containing protein [Brevundimonas sp.]|uniref:HD domain-containing protein n=1 Tax=Brevundimonas sp. TaxID=1871086 RepID=UPI002737B9D2|nr:HD domain-containing protein [Brevundimonas sp.]MDP3801282.1 HD domain-containing protein [Brevundimonas sp.]